MIWSTKIISENLGCPSQILTTTIVSWVGQWTSLRCIFTSKNRSNYNYVNSLVFSFKRTEIQGKKGLNSDVLNLRITYLSQIQKHIHNKNCEMLSRTQKNFPSLASPQQAVSVCAGKLSDKKAGNIKRSYKVPLVGQLFTRTSTWINAPGHTILTFAVSHLWGQVCIGREKKCFEAPNFSRNHEIDIASTTWLAHQRLKNYLLLSFSRSWLIGM